MPRIRSIKPKFWDDIKLSKISRDARLIFIGIWNFADDLGVIIAEPAGLKSKILPYDKLEEGVFEKWLQELIDKKFIIPISYNEENFFFIRTFDRHQKINKPNHDDICIERQSLTELINKSRNVHGTINDLELNNNEPIHGGKERIGEEKERIGKDANSVNDNFFNGNFLIPKMINAFTKQFPNYPIDKFKDAESCREISEKIAAAKKWNVSELSNGKMEEALRIWDLILLFVVSDKWYSTRSISDLNKEWQRLIQSINSKNNGKSGKQPTGKDTSLQSLYEQINSMPD